MDFLRHFFSLVCGQVNCWSAGDFRSAACQRCTGLYVGALLAAMLFTVFRPRPTSRALWLHGLAMLLMAPFGYHLVAHGPVLRSITGQLFGYGMAYYLLLVPSDWSDLWQPPFPHLRTYWYAVALIGAIPILLSAATVNSHVALVVLSWLSFAGLLTVTYLVCWNILILLSLAWIGLRQRLSAAS